MNALRRPRRSGNPITKSSAGVSVLGNLAATGVARQVTQARAGLTDPYADVHFDSLYREEEHTVAADDGVRLAARVVHGDDDPDLTVVFVHGFSLRMSSWYFQRTALATAWGEKTRLVFFDHRGHGRSEPASPETMTMSQLGDDVAAVIRALAPTSPVVIVGHSMGGMATMALARRQPELFGPGGRVIGVGLVASAARGITEAGVGEALQNPAVKAFRLAVRHAPWFIQAGRTRARRALEPVLLAASFGPDFYSPSAARAVERMIRQTPLTTIVHFLAALEEHDEMSGLPVLSRVPTVVVCGDEDCMTPYPNSYAMYGVLGDNCRLTIVQGAGHMVQMERPNEVDEVLDELVTRARAELSARRKSPRRTSEPARAESPRPVETEQSRRWWARWR
ncbi:putative hydrolase [Gordonia araii NBRC 100433]|uniref:Putative hydrolase n=1 Tax=Gordonia araii NBRC 100433 TaxID=1073574 RepID=G7GZ86_9ACTN|nr:alpha/beta hydrolase [Gordonia araii]NNG97119.1 alpha/beta hydrolase [Gordonia araii NBRC 100433]GAB08911.1 putative hydrolase [Gordonia araii NBRC 100433]